MSAIEALRMARESGVRFGVAGSDLILDADREPTPQVLEAIRRHKMGIVALLLAPGSDWSAMDWQAFFDERAAILEYDGEHGRSEAERLAFKATIIHWMNSTPPQDLGLDHCAQCGAQVGRIGPDTVPMLTGGGGHVWLHHGCHGAWMVRRRQEAAEALYDMGITPGEQRDED